MKPVHTPIVSVIIPFLNGSDWLIEAIESVISQTYHNWEMIIIDDGSEEEHSRIAREYQVEHPDRIIYSDHPGHINKGVTISRNLGISVSKGKYIAFLDSDDCWLPHKLENQLDLFLNNPDAAMMCEASRFWYSWNNPSAEDVTVSIGTEADKLYDPPKLLYNLYPLGNGAPPCPTGIIITREAFDRAGGFEKSFTGAYQLYEDQALLCKVYLREKVYISGTANNKYRKREGSLTGSGDDEKHYYLVRKFFLNWFEDYLKHHSVNDSELMGLLHKAKIKNENAAAP